MKKLKAESGRLIWDVVDVRPRARNTDPGTSHAAADSVSNVEALRQRILAVLRRFGPATHAEIILLVRGDHSARADASGAYSDAPAVTDSGVRTRTAELVKLGEVKDTGLRGKTDTGRASIRWGVS